MITASFNTKRAFGCVLTFLCFIASYSQPNVFSWNDRHRGYDYISYAKDQKEQGPCGIFATVAAVEAMVQIYFNTTVSDLNLSESNLYSSCGIHEFPAPQALAYFVCTGVIDEAHWPFPTEYVNGEPWRYYLPSPACDEYDSYDLKVKIPAWGSLSISNNTDLKKAVMDYGPIIVMGTDADQSGDSLGRALHPGGTNVNHTILLTGWNSSNWEIKDSWPGDISNRRLVGIDFFEYEPHFYRIFPVNNDNGLKYINVKDSYGTNLYTQADAEDEDKDGFFRWGLEAYPPSGFAGCDKMDFDDWDPTTICLDGYDPLPAPHISDTTSKYVCSGGRYFTLQNFSELSALGGFSVQWNVTPSNYFSSSTTGSTTTAFVDPIDSYIGKKCKIEFHLKYNGSTIKTYKFEFIINGPREDLVSTSVLDSYGGSAQGSNDFYYLCPNTNYTFYYNNSDGNCTTSSYSWTLPYGWTKNYEYSNYVSINTNDYPYGYLQIYANTSCCGSDKNVKNVYFGAAYCGEYFMIYPNPSNNSVEINNLQSNSSKEGSDLDALSRVAKCLLTVVDKSGMIKSKTEFMGFPYTLDTSKLPDGLYFLNLSWQSKKSTIRLVVKH